MAAFSFAIFAIRRKPVYRRIKALYTGIKMTEQNTGKKGGHTVALWHRCRCGAMIPQGIQTCEKCAAGDSTMMSRHMEYNMHRRDTKKAAFYVSRNWRKVRAEAMRMYDHLDVYALYVQHKIVTAEMVHHIVELEEDWSRRHDLSNLIPLSNSNHGIISALYAKDEATKRSTQSLLFRLVEEYRKG